MDKELSSQPTAAEQLFKRGQESIVQTEVGDVPVFFAPRDMQLHELQELVDDQKERPRRLKQTVRMLSAESFIEYWNEFADDQSAIFVDTENCSFVGILDYHETPDEPRRLLHTVRYDCPLTKEWKDWLKHDNNLFDQQDFAFFVEDHMKQFSQPSGGDMLKVALTIKAKTDVAFESGINLSNGEVKFGYREEINGQAGINGELAIPEEFTLAIRPFQNGAPYSIQARFRYRKSQHGLKMGFTLQQPHLSLEDATNDVYEKIKEGIDTGRIYQGHTSSGN